MIYPTNWQSRAEGGPVIPMWVIYYDPKDFPGKYVVRRWVIGAGKVTSDPEAFVCDSLAEARAAVPPGSMHLARASADEPQVKEIWI